MKHRLLTAAALVSLTAFGLAPAPATAGVYGEHVAHCAQSMGFDGTHNPGVHHRGFSGWQQHAC